MSFFNSMSLIYSSVKPRVDLQSLFDLFSLILKAHNSLHIAFEIPPSLVPNCICCFWLPAFILTVLYLELLFFTVQIMFISKTHPKCHLLLKHAPIGLAHSDLFPLGTEWLSLSLPDTLTIIFHFELY